MNEFGELIESIDDETAVENVMELGVSLKEAIEGLDDGYYYFYDGINDNEDLGIYVVDEMYGGVENLSKDMIETYFDYSALGRDLSFDEYENDDYDPEDEDSEEYISAGMYWCGDDDASDEEIGEAFVNSVGIDGVANPEYYFDFESFGRDLTFENFTLTSDGAVESL